MLNLPRQDHLRQDQMQGIYEYLANNRRLFLYGPILGYPERGDTFNPTFIADTIHVLGVLDPEKPILLTIDSPGGVVTDGMSLYDAVKSSVAPVYTIARNAFSMAAVLLSAGVSGHRYVYPNSRTMVHMPSGGARGQVLDMEKEVQEISKTNTRIVEILIENGVDRTTDEVMMDISRNFYMSAEEAVDYGVADQVLFPEMSKALLG